MLELFTQTVKYMFLSYCIEKILVTIILYSIFWPFNYKLKHGNYYTHRCKYNSTKNTLLYFPTLYTINVNKKCRERCKSPSPWHIALLPGYVWGCTSLSCWRLIHVAFDLRALKVSLTKAEWRFLQGFLSSKRAKHFLDIPKSC